jgi:FlgD Ig-like domain
VVRYKEVVLVIFFSLFASQLLSQTYIIPKLQRDDFNSDKTWWIFQNHGGQTKATHKNGYLYAFLENARNGNPVVPLDNALAEMENVGIMTADQRPIYGKDDIMDARIRVRTLNPLIPGSRGWGFWKSESVPVSINQAVWFMEQEPDLSHSWAASEDWWRARTHRTVAPTYDFSTNLDGTGGSPHNIDNQQWHYYRIIRNGRNSYNHYVDGTLIQSIVPADFPDGKILNEDYSFNCWNDNLVYHFTQNAISGNDTIEVYANGWIDTTEFIVDFIEIRYGNYKPDSSYTPIGSKLLREVINEIDDGMADGAFKGPYTFTVPTGGAKVIVIASGKAEELDTYDTDDDIKMILDSKDFGFNTTRSWNGDVDMSALKTIVIDTTLPEGSHSLSFETETTPILYDATVLGSVGGALVLNQTIDASAPIASSNFEWQTFTFNADAGELVIYVSGSADEEPGWNHQNASIDSTDDDELRIELDGYDFGWEVDSSSFLGNTLFGDFKTICIRRTVATTGSHTLKLFVNESPFVHKVLVFAKNGDSALPVKLSSFSVNEVNGKNTITWVTESELENAGFNVLRAVSASEQAPRQKDFIKINAELIRGRGNASTQKTYTYVDEFNAEGQIAWYMIQDVSISGKIESHGPIRLIETIQPGKFELKQNYPNPFNPSTIIPFELAEAGNVSLSIFDVRGGLVKSILLNEVGAGENSFVWYGDDNSGNHVASGIYYYRVKSGNFTAIRKMALVR